MKIYRDEKGNFAYTDEEGFFFTSLRTEDYQRALVDKFGAENTWDRAVYEMEAQTNRRMERVDMLRKSLGDEMISVNQESKEKSLEGWSLMTLEEAEELWNSQIRLLD